MLFNSPVFLGLFLPLTLLGFFIAARLGRRPAVIWLVLASLVFYAWWNPAFLPLLLVSVAFNYASGRAIVRAQARPRLQSALLVLAIAGNLGLLFYFKYFAAVAQTLAAIGIGHGVDTIILPLGISFFTFTQIGYLIDLKQGTAEDHGPLNFALFVTFFPHLIAGPILHNREMLPQFARDETYRFSLSNLNVGLAIFTIGLFKKTVLADPLAVDVHAGFDAPAGLGTFDTWRTVCTYSLQLYFDFSGYSDMAIGLARMFNMKFPINFDSPFKSQSVAEYWQRWHMTLTRYLTLYVFNPLALAVARWRVARGLKSTRSAQQSWGGFLSLIAFPTMTTMIICGIWHGAGVQFLIFGLLHGAYLTTNHLVRVVFPVSRAAPPPPAWRRGLRRVCNVALTYVAVLVALVFFRAPSLGGALTILGGMAGLHGDAIARPVSAPTLLWTLLLYGVIWGLPNVQQLMASWEPAIGRPRAPLSLPALGWRPDWRWAVALGAMLALGVVGMDGSSDFLYFQF
jgi:D-alanyl-lipoteichoic acid acyltransferase DltB (MBOAT superfamily)